MNDGLKQKEVKVLIFDDDQGLFLKKKLRAPIKNTGNLQKYVVFLRSVSYFQSIKGKQNVNRLPPFEATAGSYCMSTSTFGTKCEGEILVDCQ